MADSSPFPRRTLNAISPLLSTVTNMRLTILLATAITLFAQADVTLQRAIRKETLEGDLKGAIALYEKAVTEAKNNRPVAAKALIRLAECHQKLGNTEPRKIYERILRDYADQAEPAELARKKLGATDIKNAGIVTRQVWAGPKVIINGSVSADGRFISFTERPSGNLMLHDLKTGADQLLAEARDGGQADQSTLAPSGRMVAYVWMKKAGGAELRLVEIKGNVPSAPRILYQNPDVRYPGPWAWSADSQWIGVQLQRTDRTVQIAMLSARDGALRILKSVGWGGAGNMALSPDGKYLAYSLSTRPESRSADIFVIATDGSQESAVVTDPNSDDRPMVWSPDGSHLLFVSDRGEKDGLWALPVREGKAAGSPKLVRAGVTGIQGITRSGTLFYSEHSGNAELVTTAIDLATGKLQSPPAVEAKTPYPGRWSPDGRSLAVGLPTRSGGQFWRIRIRSLDTAQVRELEPKLRYVTGFCSLGDSGKFLAAGTDLKGRMGIFRLDAQTGEAEPLEFAKVADRSERAAPAAQPQCASDGNRILFTRFLDKPDAGKGEAQVVTKDVASGEEREILRFDLDAKPLPALVLSPDGGKVAYCGQKSTVTVRSVMSGESQELPIPGEPGPSEVSAWTADGRYLVVRKVLNAAGDAAFFLLPAAGGEPIRLEMPHRQARALSIHPGGKLATFQVPLTPTSTLIAMENALAALEPRAEH